MKKYLGVLMSLTLLGSASLSIAKDKSENKSEGPVLNFKNEDSQGDTENNKFGDKPLAKFGDENNYIKLGGYGSMRFESGTADDVKETFTLRRFVLTTDAKVASRFRINTELEFERFRKIELERSTSASSGGGLELSQEIEGTSGSEIAMEQAWFEVDFTDAFRFRGGGVLVPVGRFNINHDDNQWSLPRRSLIDRGVPVLPSTAAWNELGFGVNGDLELGEKSKLGYQFYVVNGAVLDMALEQVVEARVGDTAKTELEGELGMSTGTFSRDVKNAKTLTGRLTYSPALGHEFGVSGYWGRYTPDYLAGKNMTVFGFDTLQVFGNFEVEAEYLYTKMGGLRNVMDSFATAVQNGEVEIEDATVPPGIETEVAFKPSRLSSSKQGYWMELRYRWRPEFLTNSWVGKHFSDPQLIPVLRWEQAFINDRLADVEMINGAVATYATEDRRVDRLTAGLAFRLTPLSLFQLAYEYTQTDKNGALADVVNYLETAGSKNHSVMFGAAFGF